MATAAQKVMTKFGRLALRIQRAAGRGASAATPPYYQPAPSCQIPELATLYSLFLGERADGFFVEVGAFDGISFSNSSCLAAVGWGGLLVEPIPKFAALCRARYRGNTQVQVVESAVGDHDADIEIAIAGPLTTTNAEVMDRYRGLEWSRAATLDSTRLKVRQTTLNQLLETHAPAGRALDVLIVDVEGAEQAVFSGFSLERWRPVLIIVELSHTHPDLHAISAHDAFLQQSIQGAGYEVIYKDRINTVFVRRTEVEARLGLAR